MSGLLFLFLLCVAPEFWLELDGGYKIVVLVILLLDFISLSGRRRDDD